MTVNELYTYLDKKIPASLSCEWDNDGLMCCPDGEKIVRRALVCLDVTADAIKKAVELGCDVIVSHHPFIFKGLRSLDQADFIPKKAIELIKNDISVMSFHTRLDALTGGVNDVLASLLGLCEVMPFGDEQIGRIGTLEDVCDIECFAKRVKKALGAPTVLYTDTGKKVRRVAVLGGEGEDDIRAAIDAGVDTYVSGRLGYHNMTDSPDMGINLIESGHFYTEYPICDVLCKMLAECDIETVKYNSNRIKNI